MSPRRALAGRPGPSAGPTAAPSSGIAIHSHAKASNRAPLGSTATAGRDVVLDELIRSSAVTEGAFPQVVPAAARSRHVAGGARLAGLGVAVAAGALVPCNVAACAAQVVSEVMRSIGTRDAWRRLDDGRNIFVAARETAVMGLDDSDDACSGARLGSSRHPRRTARGARPRHFHSNDLVFHFATPSEADR